MKIFKRKMLRRESRLMLKVYGCKIDRWRWVRVGWHFLNHHSFDGSLKRFSCFRALRLIIKSIEQKLSSFKYLIFCLTVVKSCRNCKMNLLGLYGCSNLVLFRFNAGSFFFVEKRVFVLSFHSLATLSSAERHLRNLVEDASNKRYSKAVSKLGKSFLCSFVSAF